MLAHASNQGTFLTGECFFDFFLPDAKEFFPVGLALSQFPFTFPLFVEETFEVILAARYSVDNAGSCLVTGDGLWWDESVQINDACFVFPSCHVIVPP